MHLLRSEHFWWLTCNAVCGALAATLYVRRAYRRSPVFTAWITQVFLGSLALNTLSNTVSAGVYSRFYWILACVEIALQVSVAIEFAFQALRYRGTWVPMTKVPLMACSTVTVLLAGIFTACTHPAAPELADQYYARVTLLSSLLIFWGALSLLSIAYGAGSLWGPPDLYRFIGFLSWAAASALNDTMHVYARFVNYFSLIEYVHMGISMSVMVYWLVTSFLPAEHFSRSDQPEISGLLTAVRG